MKTTIMITGAALILCGCGPQKTKFDPQEARLLLLEAEVRDLRAELAELSEFSMGIASNHTATIGEHNRIVRRLRDDLYGHVNDTNAHPPARLGAR